MSKAADEEIVAWAGLDATVVTLDVDFHAILAVSGRPKPSVVRLRIEGLGAAEVTSHVQQAIARFGAELGTGALVTVKLRKITCHGLPIGDHEA
jgi:predicted nuclease of predicted toxin-antitoxin system